MLRVPDGYSDTFTIIALDPASDSLGCAIITVDIVSLEIVSTEATTFRGSKLARNYEWVVELFGERVGRITAHEKNLLRIFKDTNPFDIVSEAPFMGRFPAAYGALVEVICAIRRAVVAYDPWKKLNMIDPPTVKLAVGAEVRGGKDSVRNAILRMADQLKFKGDVPLDKLDEHSIDAIAVGFCRLQQLRGQ
jgi:Holliday junction resolvasome RuvABC endonuclease subunit